MAGPARRGQGARHDLGQSRKQVAFARIGVAGFQRIIVVSHSSNSPARRRPHCWTKSFHRVHGPSFAATAFAFLMAVMRSSNEPSRPAIEMEKPPAAAFICPTARRSRE